MSCSRPRRVDTCCLRRLRLLSCPFHRRFSGALLDPALTVEHTAVLLDPRLLRLSANPSSGHPQLVREEIRITIEGGGLVVETLPMDPTPFDPGLGERRPEDGMAA